MLAGRLPSGLPGSLVWKARQVGVPAYNLALAAAGEQGRTGNQARFYMAMFNHRRMRQMALAAAQQRQQ